MCYYNKDDKLGLQDAESKHFSPGKLHALNVYSVKKSNF